MYKNFLIIILFFLIPNNIIAKEKYMILKLKDGDVEMNYLKDKHQNM